MSQDASQAVGSVSGGAIGGVTAAGVSAGATVLGSMAFGAEVGDAVGGSTTDIAACATTAPTTPVVSVVVFGIMPRMTR